MAMGAWVRGLSVGAVAAIVVVVLLAGGSAAVSVLAGGFRSADEAAVGLQMVGLVVLGTIAVLLGLACVLLAVVAARAAPR